MKSILLKIIPIGIMALFFNSFAYAYDLETENWAGGNGSKENPYQISNIKQLRKLAADAEDGNYHDDEYFVLTQDIIDHKENLIIDNMGGSPNMAPYWKAIKGFNGHLDGQNHCISGLDAGTALYYDSHTFFIASMKGTISNLTIKNSILTGWVSNGEMYDGYSKIENCKNYATTKF